MSKTGVRNNEDGEEKDIIAGRFNEGNEDQLGRGV